MTDQAQVMREAMERLEAKRQAEAWRVFNRGPKGPTNGQNRRTSSAAHGSAVDRASASPGTRVTWATNTAVLRPGAVYPIAGASPAALVMQAMNDLLYGRKPEAAPIPYAGIRAGEIIGYRAWKVFHNLNLSSLAHLFIWEPGATIEGDLNEVVMTSFDGFNLISIYGGVYAYADESPCQAERERWQRRLISTGDDIYRLYGIALGTVKLWGEVVEHERGYRAQYAKIASLDEVIGDVDLQALRDKYNV